MAESPTHTNTVRKYLRAPDGARPDLEALESAAEAIHELRQGRGWKLLRNLLDAERAAIEDALDERLHDHATYAHEHGRLSGLKAAEGLIAAVTELHASELERQRDKHEGG